MPNHNFSNLFLNLDILSLRSYLLNHPCFIKIMNTDRGIKLDSNLSKFDSWENLRRKWQNLQSQRLKCELSLPSTSANNRNIGNKPCVIQKIKYIEHDEVEWLIHVFNKLFFHKNVELVRGGCEPEYFPAQHDRPARIEFAHGFFSSALHELSHWTIAGAHRRTLPDFGYWYASDGRNETQQKSFEKVEIKPQAIECLYTQMCHIKFSVSKDNLLADFDTTQSTFETDVLTQANAYINFPNTLPQDALTFLSILAYLCRDNTLSQSSN